MYTAVIFLLANHATGSVPIGGNAARLLAMNRKIQGQNCLARRHGTAWEDYLETYGDPGSEGGDWKCSLCGIQVEKSKTYLKDVCIYPL